MRGTLDDVRLAAASCQACDLRRTGTQTVFGEGTEAAGLMLVGEQPGANEDLAGRPLVGPAGRLLHEGAGRRQTVHPSSILRAPDLAARESEMAAFAEDLRLVAGQLRAR